MYDDYDVILTTENEFMFYWEAEKYHCLVERKATKEEAKSYKSEWEYWQKEKWDVPGGGYNSSNDFRGDVVEDEKY
jgi:hypothetical protein